MRIVVKLLLVLAIAFALLRADGLQIIDMPFPDVIAPMFGMWAGEHEDAMIMELLIEFLLIAVAIVFGGDWLLRRWRDSN